MAARGRSCGRVDNGCRGLRGRMSVEVHACAYGCNEAISPAGNCLDVPWLFGIIAEDLADFADCSVDGVVSIEEDLRAPDALDNLLASNNDPALFNQEEQKLRRNALQFKHPPAA